MDKDFEENPVLVITVGSVLAMTLASAGATWLVTQSRVVVQWLVDHKVLVPAQEAVISLGEGGLDMARIVLLVSVLVLVLVVSVMVTVRIRTFRRRRALRELTM